MATPFEEFVNRELPRRPAMLTFTVTGYDGDPNNILAPTIVSAAPAGSFYLRQTDPTLYWKKTAAAGSYEEVGAGGGGGGSVTVEDLYCYVDYQDPTAVDPPVGTMFTTQAQIDQFLADEGATAFKHIQSIWDATPKWVNHYIVFECAPGVHRPRDDMQGGIAWDLSGKYRVSPTGYVDLSGAPSSLWEELAPGESITASVGGTDPYIDVAGTPWAGLDLRGYYAIASGGAVNLIHEHTDSRLRVMESYVPSAGQVVRIARPSTIFRNSLNDSSAAYGIGFCWEFVGSVDESYITSITFEPFGNAQWSVSFRGSVFNLSYVLIDNLGVLENFGVSPNGHSFSVQGVLSPATVFGEHVSVRGRLSGFGNFDDAAVYVGWGYAGFALSMFLGGEDGCVASSPVSGHAAGQVEFYESVLDTVGRISGTQFSIDIRGGAVLGLWTGFYSGKRNEIRGGNSMGAVYVQGPFSSVVGMDFIATNIEDAIITIADSSSVKTGYTGLFGAQHITDGGGNGSYGVAFYGANNEVEIDNTSTFGAPLGDVKFADEDVWSLADIESLGPIVDGLGNSMGAV